MTLPILGAVAALVIAYSITFFIGSMMSSDAAHAEDLGVPVVCVITLTVIAGGFAGCAANVYACHAWCARADQVYLRGLYEAECVCGYEVVEAEVAP